MPVLQLGDSALPGEIFSPAQGTGRAVGDEEGISQQSAHQAALLGQPVAHHAAAVQGVLEERVSAAQKGGQSPAKHILPTKKKPVHGRLTEIFLEEAQRQDDVQVRFCVYACV
jgi:hypothetical protein